MRTDSPRLSLSLPSQLEFIGCAYSKLLTDWPKVRWVLLILTILMQCVAMYAEGPPILGTDVVRQIDATQSLLNGTGLTNFFATDASDLSQLSAIPLTNWPPAYSLLLSPLLLLTSSIRWVVLILDMLAVSLFFSAWFVILEALGDYISKPIRLFIWLYWAFIFAPVLWVSDQLALTFFSAGLAVCVWLITQEKHLLWWGGLSGVCMGISAAARFQYWPLLAVPPLALLAYAIVKRQRRFLFAGIVNGTVSGSFIVSIMLHNYLAAGRISYINRYYETNSVGFFWEHLTRFAPFPASALGMEKILDYLHGLGLSQAAVTGTAWIISAIMLAIFVLVLVWGFRQHTGKKESSNAPDGMLFFRLIAVLTFGVTVSMLTYLTVRYKEPKPWSYVQEIRYYSAIFPFLVIAIMAFIVEPPQFKWGNIGRRVLNWLRKVALVLVVFGVVSIGALRAYDIAKKLSWRITQDFIPGYESATNPVSAALTAVNEEDLPIIVIVDPGVWDAPNTRNKVLLEDSGYLYNGDIPPDGQFATTQPVVVIVAVPHEGESAEENIAALTTFVTENEGIQVGELYNMMLFRLTLQPSA
jgi:hypothetical protein